LLSRRIQFKGTDGKAPSVAIPCSAIKKLPMWQINEWPLRAEAKRVLSGQPVYMASNGIGAALRAIRVREKLSLTAVARKAGISDAMLSRIERGERASPQFTTIAKIAYVLGTSLDEIAHAAGIATAVHRRTPSTAARDIRRSEKLDKLTTHLEKALTLASEAKKSDL